MLDQLRKESKGILTNNADISNKSGDQKWNGCFGGSTNDRNGGINSVERSSGGNGSSNSAISCMTATCKSKNKTS